MQLNTLTPPAPSGRVVPHGWQPTVTAADLLAARGAVTVPPDWWSWAGAHGGLLVALAAGDASAAAPDVALRSSTAQLLRPVRGPLVLASRLVHAGRRVTTVRTEGFVHGRPSLVVHSTFGPPAEATGAGDALPAPLVHAPEDLPGFTPPAELVPFGQHVDIRPTDDVIPLAGTGSTARLTAWVRLRDESGAPGPLRTTVLADALAPSLYAVLDHPAAVPTVEMSVHHRAPSAPAAGLDPAPASERVAGPEWLLVRARTDWSDEGWVTEAVDLWDRAGTHVATSRQLRLVSS